MRTIGVVTVGRSDYGIYRSVLEAIQADPDLDLSIYISGMHLSPSHGMTADVVRKDGYRVADELEMLLASDSPAGVSKSIGVGVQAFAQSFARWKPDILVVLGDRFEMFAPVIAALPFRLPVAHLHGGEATFGAIDEAIRHSITKMSHLHFVSTEVYAKRVAQLGEEAWRITVSGAPAIDSILNMELPTKAELEQRFGFSLATPPLLVTYHPVTMEHERTNEYIETLLSVLSKTGMPIVFTQPNADTGGLLILSKIQEFLLDHPSASLVENFGARNYYAMLKYSAAMVGNSSSGLIETMAFKLPVVNIGSRQDGRLRPPNVIDCPDQELPILEAINRALSSEFRSSFSDKSDPYGDGTAAQKIIDKLKSVPLDQKLISKRFSDL